MFTPARQHRYEKLPETYVVFGYDHENPYVSCTRMKQNYLDQMLRHPTFKDCQTTLPFSFDEELFAPAKSSDLKTYLSVEDLVTSNTLSPGSITDTELKRKKLKDCVPSTFWETCGLKDKDESEPAQDQLLSSLPKAMSEAPKLDLLEKVDLWDDEFTFQDDTPPPNLLYQQNLQKTNTLFTFDDPLIIAYEHLNQLLPTALKIEDTVPSVPLIPKLIKMSEKEVLYPSTPRYDYLRELARCEMENSKIKDSDGHQIEKIQVDLPDWALEVVQAMEGDMIICWKILKSIDLPVLANVLKNCQTLAEVQPNLTRLCLIKLNEEISKTKKDPSKSLTEGKLKEVLPVLLHFHGVVKAVDVFMNLDFKLALETLVDFRDTHKEMLPREFFALVVYIADLFPLALERQKIVHAKLPILHDLLAHHLEGATGRKVWIRLHRTTSQVATNIRDYLTEVGVKCSVDPRILPFGTANEDWFSNSPVIISDRLSKDLPLNLVSLVIDYEPSPKSQDNQLAVIQKVLIVPRLQTPRSPLVEPNTNLDRDVPVEIPAVSELQITCDRIPAQIQEDQCSVNITVNQVSIENNKPQETLSEPGSSLSSINPSEEDNREAPKGSRTDDDDIQSYDSCSYGRCSDDEYQVSQLSEDSILLLDEKECPEEGGRISTITLFEAEDHVESQMESADIAHESSIKIMEEEFVQSSGDLFEDPSQDDMGSGSAPKTRNEIILEAEEHNSDLVESTNRKKGDKTSSGEINCTSQETSTSNSTGNQEARVRQEPIDPSPDKDLDIDEEADEPSQEEEGEKLNLIMAAHLESNQELMQALTKAKYLNVYRCDYKFLDNFCKYQPDFLISSRTALIIVDEEMDTFQDTRLKILNASFKCSVCLVVLLSPRVFVTKKIPPIWSSLVGLSRFYETMDSTNSNAFGFQLYLRLVTNYDQVAFIILDTARDEQYPDIEEYLQPITPDVEVLLHFRQFNAVSAQRVLQYITPKELVSLPLKKIFVRIRSKHLRRIIKLFLEQTSAIEYHTPAFNDFLVPMAVHQVKEDPNFGELKSTTTQEPKEDFAFLQSPNKKARRDTQRKTFESSSNNVAADLMRLWNSPTFQR